MIRQAFRDTVESYLPKNKDRKKANEV
jgi:hypothetical protein